eukprot:scaffold136219_cov33-Tisochrysis_lutea.AAC.1
MRAGSNGTVDFAHPSATNFILGSLITHGGARAPTLSLLTPPSHVRIARPRPRSLARCYNPSSLLSPWHHRGSQGGRDEGERESDAIARALFATEPDKNLLTISHTTIECALTTIAVEN